MATISRVAGKTMSAVLALAILTVGFIITAQTAYAADEHTLTYTKGELTWTDTPVDKNGAAILNLFSNAYMNVNSGTAEKLVAPGTSGETTIRLKNAVKGKVTYTAVLYHQKTSEDLPVITELNAGAEADETGVFDLPEGVSAGQVIRAVSGTMEGGEAQELAIRWNWPIDGDSVRDTALGNEQEPDEYLVGLYVVVEDENTYTTPGGSPQTGGGSKLPVLGMLSALCILCAAMLAAKVRRKEKCER